MKKGCPYGTHRVISPKGVLPQPADVIDNTMEIYDNEVLIDVQTLNVDSASFTEIVRRSCDGKKPADIENSPEDQEKVKQTMMNIVAKAGKHKNPWTGSGGMLLGTVKEIGPNYVGDLKVGDKIATLVSLSLTPLKIDEILEMRPSIDQVDIKGQAILFQSGIYGIIPDDMPEGLALSALDVAGAPAQAAKLCQSATDAVGMYNKAMELTGGELFDVVINCVNIENTEMASILSCKDDGTVYFFSMATSFTKAALGAEGVGKDVNMIVGNGYTKGHAAITLQCLREHEGLRKLFEEMYA